MNRDTGRSRRSILKYGLVVGAGSLAGCSNTTEDETAGSDPTQTATFTTTCSKSELREFSDAADTRAEAYQQFAKLYSPERQTEQIADEVLPDLKSLIPMPRVVGAIEQAQTFTESADRTMAAQILRKGSHTSGIDSDASASEHEEAAQTNRDLAQKAGAVSEAADTYAEDPSPSNRTELVSALRDERELLASTPEVKEWSNIEAGEYSAAQGVLYDDGAEYIRQFASANYQTFQSYREKIADQLSCMDAAVTTPSGTQPETTEAAESTEPTSRDDVGSGSAMFQYDAANTGYAPTVSGPTGDVKAAWTTSVGNNSVESSPVVVDGTVYVGSRNGNVSAVNATDGSVEWTFETGGPVNSSPAVANDTVYVGSSDETIYAINAGDGTKRWSTSAQVRVLAGPTVKDGTVYVPYNGINGVRALDGSDGSEQWVFETDIGIDTAVAVTDGGVYAADKEGTVYAIDPADGTEQWRFETEDAATAPTVSDGTVYVGTVADRVYAIDAADGSEQWSFETGAAVYGSPAVADGTIYIGDRAGDSGIVYAVDAADGTEQWTYNTGFFITASPIVAGNTVYVGSDGVYALNTTDGSEQWSFETEAGYIDSAAPVAANGAVYVADGDGTLSAIIENS